MIKLSDLKLGDTFIYENVNYIFAGKKNDYYFAYHSINKKVQFDNDVEVKKI